MSVEQVARDFISMMTDVEAAKAHLAPDATVSGGILPQALPAADAFNLIGGLMSAFPDLKFEVQQVTVNGDQATVNAHITGTNSAALDLPVPGMPINLPATGKKVSVMDTYLVTVKGDKVTHMQVDSPADGGIPAMLGQLGVKMPGM